MGTCPASLRIVAQIRKDLWPIDRCAYSDMGTYPAFLDRLAQSHHLGRFFRCAMALEYRYLSNLAAWNPRDPEHHLALL